MPSHNVSRRLRVFDDPVLATVREEMSGYRRRVERYEAEQVAALHASLDERDRRSGEAGCAER